MRSEASNKRRIPIVVLALVSTSVVACNAILGLNDFEKVPELADASFDAAPDQLTPDASPDVGPPPIPTGTAPPLTRWARWHMPDAVQVPPYGGAGAKFGPSYSDAGAADFVVDNVTNLVWLKKVFPADSFQQAVQRCAEAPNAGAGFKWRVPSRIELVTLLDHTKTGVRIDPVFNERIDSGLVPPAGGVHWTGSVAYPVVDVVNFWVVDFTSGQVRRSATATSVRCVRGAA
ncbi:MAG: DUF1566 domain-containing protein [Myxococcales bacterium]|nr:DUF1566 domain-containing protein [Myxococcales bacterium]